MRVLLLGSGAKDHAMAWLFSQSKLIDGLFVAKGNVGTSAIAKNLVDVNPSSAEDVYKACVDNDINYVFIGTEDPLLTGVIDYLNSRGIDTFGAPSYAIKLENDRYFARQFTDRHNIPTPPYRLFSDEKALSDFLKENPNQNFVLKRNAMAPSRVMVDSNNYDTLMRFGKSILKDDYLLVENHMTGLPITATVFVDNNGYLMLPLCSDYFKAEDGGTGSPTGGMGSICPVPLRTQNHEKLINQIIEPTLSGLQAENLAYKGVLTFSLILTDDGPVLVDYHVRFNDPATQAIAPLIKSDIIEMLDAMKQDRLREFNLEVSTQSAVAVVVASKGYPEEPIVGKVVEPLPLVIKNNLLSNMPKIFYGAVMDQDGKATTVGGRNVTVVGIGHNIIAANKHVYNYINNVKFEDSWYRNDVGNKFFEN